MPGATVRLRSHALTSLPPCLRAITPRPPSPLAGHMLRPGTRRAARSRTRSSFRRIAAPSPSTS